MNISLSYRQLLILIEYKFSKNNGIWLTFDRSLWARRFFHMSQDALYKSRYIRVQRPQSTCSAIHPARNFFPGVREPHSQMSAIYKSPLERLKYSAMLNLTCNHSTCNSDSHDDSVIAFYAKMECSWYLIDKFINPGGYILYHIWALSLKNGSCTREKVHWNLVTSSWLWLPQLVTWSWLFDCDALYQKKASICGIE